MKKNNKLLKSLLIFFTITFFLGLTVFLIIITRGGKITPEGIIETGVIRIITEPTNTDLSVYVDEAKVSVVENSIKNLDEGTHVLKIESEGYAPWQKEVSIVSGIVTEVMVRLYPTNISLQQVTNSDIDSLFFSPDNDYAYYIVTKSEFGSAKGLWKIRLTENQAFFGENNLAPEKIYDITTDLETLITDPTYQILPSKDDKKVLITNSTSIYLFDVDNNTEPRNIAHELSIFPKNVTWFDDSNSLIIKDENIIYEYDLTSKSKTLIHYTQADLLPYNSNNEVVYFFDNESKILNKYINTTASTVTPVNTELPTDILSLYLPKEATDIVIAKTTTDYQYINIKKGIIKSITTADYNLLKVSPNGKSILFEKDNEIYSFTIKENITTKTIESKFTMIIKNYNNDTNVLGYTTSGTHVTYYNGEKGSISILEADGSNMYPIDINGFNIKAKSFSLNSTEESLFLLLSDSTNRTNVFRIDLITL